MTTQQNILVIKLGALGDFIQALGPMAAIRDHHPDARITLLTTAPFVSFGRDCGYFDEIWTDSKPRWSQIKEWAALRNKLNSGRFARVYDLQNNDRTGLYFKLFTPKPEWVGTAKGASHRNASPERTAGHAFDGHVQTLSLAGIDNVSVDSLEWIKGDSSHFDIPHPYILLAPGCAPSRPEKQWPATQFGILARTLYGWGFTPVILGTVQESVLVPPIQQQCPQIVDLTGRTSLNDIVLLARDAAGAVGNDTGPMHLIAATLCPSFVLFSQHSDPVKHAPQGDHVKTITVKELSGLPASDVIAQLHTRDFR